MATNVGKAALVGLVLASGAGASWWWHVTAERECHEAERNAADLFDRHEPIQSLEVVDEVDARCNCARFTSGDEPGQTSIARACLRQLSREGRVSEAREVLGRARGPILRELAKTIDGG